MYGKTLYHSHIDDFKMFFTTTIVPLASYNAELASKQAEKILASFAKELVQAAGR